MQHVSRGTFPFLDSPSVTRALKGYEADSLSLEVCMAYGLRIQGDLSGRNGQALDGGPQDPLASYRSPGNH